MKLIYTHEIIDEIIELLNLEMPLTKSCSKIEITLQAGDVVRVIYHKSASRFGEEPF